MMNQSDLPCYEVIALKYATREGRRPDHFVGGDPHDVPMPMDYYLWVIRDGQRLVLVDTGFNQDMADKRHRTLLRRPADALKLLGIDTKDIAEIVITHLHNDHVGTFDEFPIAKFHLQDDEMKFATGRLMCCERFSRAFEVDHVAGMQVVRVHTARGWVVLASDASHYYEHFEQKRCFHLVYHLGEAIEGYERLVALGQSPRHVVPGHDPLVVHRYPAVSEALTGIAMRLDLEPIEY